MVRCLHLRQGVHLQGMGEGVRPRRWGDIPWGWGELGVSKNGWVNLGDFMENPIKIHDLGGTPISGNQEKNPCSGTATYCLVVEPPLWNIWKLLGMMTFPRYGNRETIPNHQPVNLGSREKWPPMTTHVKAPATSCCSGRQPRSGFLTHHHRCKSQAGDHQSR